jgi:predicted lipid-binding transport protein (Tim44 family)
LFAELQNMMKDMVGGENFTEVDTLHSELVDQSFEGDYFIVSIRFSGFIKESKQDEAHAFNEIWHIRRLAAGEGNWLIAGIQQSA